MRARNLTLTSIGLPLRAELRLKSLLEVVHAKTTEAGSERRLVRCGREWMVDPVAGVW
jgi:hypothetical protein